MLDPRLRSQDAGGPSKPPALRAGDSVRLKFLYPGGAVEIVDCTWIAVVALGADGSDATSPWVVIEFEDRRIWKPLGCLVQVEVLEEGHDSGAAPDRVPPQPTRDLGYHR